MTPEITDLIKKKAEEIFPFEYKGSLEETIERAYTTGQIEAIKMMIGFFTLG